MSDPADRFAADAPGIHSATDVRTGEFVHTYHGELGDSHRTVRVLTVAPEASASVRNAFTRVARQWANASTHPNVVTVHDHGTTPRPWVAVALVDGQPLTAARADLPLAAVPTVAADVAEALRNAGLYNTSHHALSPERVWIPRADGDVTALVGDWGLERACRLAAGEPTVTPYTAPELLTDPEGDADRTDVYGLGAVTYYALTGRPPVTDDGDLETAIETAEPQPPSELAPVPEAVDRVVLEALAADPSARQGSAYEFRGDILQAFPDDLDVDDSTGTTPAATEAGDTDSDAPATDDEIGEPDTSPETGERASAQQSSESDAESDTRGDTGSTTRRAALGVLGLGAVGGVAWVFSELGTSDHSPSGASGTATGRPGPAGAATATPNRKRIRISGSETLYPLVQAAVQQFRADHAGVEFDVTGQNTAVGFEDAFVPGESDLNNSTRPITEAEAEACRETGFEPVRFRIGQTAIVVLAHGESDWFDSLSLGQLRELWAAETSPERWGEVEPDWPDVPIECYAPGEGSAAADYFAETVVGTEGSPRSDVQRVDEPGTIVQAVRENPLAIGYLSFSDYPGAGDDIETVELEGEDGPAEPGVESARRGTYPLARPLYCYANGSRLQNDPTFREFVGYYAEFSVDGAVSEQSSCLPSSYEMAEENLDTLDEYTD